MVVGTTRRSSVPPVGAGTQGELRVDQDRPFPHPADSGALGRPVHAAPVVGDEQRDIPGATGEFQLDLGRRGMPGDVRQALLGDPVQHQFGVLAQWRQCLLQPGSDRDGADPGEVGRQRMHGAEQPQIFQHPGAEPAGDHPDLVQAVPDHLLHDLQLVPQIGRDAVDGAFQARAARPSGSVRFRRAVPGRCVAVRIPERPSACALLAPRSCSSRSSISLNVRIR